MMALGFIWILIPVAKKLCSSIEEQSDFLKRHLRSFNANPYLASYVVGAVTKLEEDKISGEQIERFKDSSQGPLGALGDRLIWQNLRPALLILGIVLSSVIGILGAVSFFLIFNFHQAYLRARGIMKGYALGFGVSSDLSLGYLQSMTKWSGRLGAFLLGILFVLKLHPKESAPFRPENVILLSLFSLISFLAFKRNINPNYTLLISFALFLVIKAMITWI